MKKTLSWTAVAVLGSAVLSLSPANAARHRGFRHSLIITRRARRTAAPRVIIPPIQTYDEIKLVVDKQLMPVRGGYFAPSEKLTAGTFVDGLRRLRAQYAYRGVRNLPPLPRVSAPTAPLSRQQAVQLLVQALVARGAQRTWSDEQVQGWLIDYQSTSPAYRASVAMAAERLYIPNPLRPGEVADRGFGALLLARAFPWGAYVPDRSPAADEIRKALAMHLLFASGRFPESTPVTPGVLARAVQRARMYLPSEMWTLLPEMQVDSTVQHPLTRAEAITMVAQGLVADYRLSSRLAAMGSRIEDRDAGYAFASQPDWYLQGFKDIGAIPPRCMGPVAVGTYKGWIPNLSSEPGKLGPGETATMGYVATLLARAVVRPGDYTGIAIDMSHLRPLDRAGGMWVLAAGDNPGAETKALRIYPNAYPVKAFAQAPGALGFYGDLLSAERGRAGNHPYVIHALDWARYDWSTRNGEPGLRRGGGLAISLATYPFNMGTPPLILISKQDAAMISKLDKTSLLLRTARIALVQSNWSLTAMR